MRQPTLTRFLTQLHTFAAACSVVWTARAFRPSFALAVVNWILLSAVAISLLMGWSVAGLLRAVSTRHPPPLDLPHLRVKPGPQWGGPSG